MALERTLIACAGCLVLCLLGILLPSECGTVMVSSVWIRAWAHLTCTCQIKSLRMVFDLLLCDEAAWDVAASSTVSWWNVGRKLHHCCGGRAVVSLLEADDASCTHV